MKKSSKSETISQDFGEERKIPSTQIAVALRSGFAALDRLDEFLGGLAVRACLMTCPKVKAI